MSVKLLTWEEAVQWLINQPDKQELVRQCYYDEPLQLSAERFSNSEEWLAVKNLLKKYIPGQVLDLGAGRGISSYAFAKSKCLVTALEPDPSPIVGSQAIQSLFNSTNLPIQIVQEYGEILPFPENSFDIVYGRAVLHHACDLKQFCKEAARVLKPGGIFIATREHVISQKEDLPKFLDSHPLHFLYGGENAYRVQEYKQAIKAAELKLEKVLASYESVINYAPITQKEFESAIVSVLSYILGKKLATGLAANITVQQLAGWYKSRISNVPGRLYTFLAVKY
ncbi:SAM-dependent methyltransferase [Nostoc sp. T09]|uniref:class I SAM-dependent methyltransferase n=1 Tax=Nostoc sp. T09 TaxID=1932621 RepID=UPI000A3D22D3|nr:class I SAM-dependent methyltransferase [Nostoc sp. T09]OUL37707.1 SAM-dependent methyltransferase [Nostoc sp. T09]